MCPSGRAGQQELATSDRVWLRRQRKRSWIAEPTTKTTTKTLLDNMAHAADVGSYESWDKVNTNELSTPQRASGVRTSTRPHRAAESSLPMDEDQEEEAAYNCTRRQRRLSGSRMFSLCDLAPIMNVDSDADNDYVYDGQRRASRRGTLGDNENDDDNNNNNYKHDESVSLVDVSNHEFARDNNEIVLAPDNNWRISIRSQHREAPSNSTKSGKVKVAPGAKRSALNQSRIELLGSEAKYSDSRSSSNSSTMLVANDENNQLPTLLISSTKKPKFRRSIVKKSKQDHWRPSSAPLGYPYLIVSPNFVAAQPRRLSSRSPKSPSLESKKLFLAFMMPTLALSLLLVLASAMQAQLARANPTDQVGSRLLLSASSSNQHADLVAAMPPFAPTRRPSAMQLLYDGQHHVQHQPSVTTTYSDHDRSVMMPNELNPVVASNHSADNNNPNSGTISNSSNNNNRNDGQPITLVHNAASSMNNPKFTRTNELEAFLDDMNHKELQTVASGKPIEDLFQPKSFGMTPIASHSSQQKPRTAISTGPSAGESSEPLLPTGRRLTDRSPKAVSGLMTSQSEQQIYSDCALILQRTYVKNMEDSKHQLVPFGKTEQACISYKHIDKAIEQAKHKLKFREFVKMRNNLVPNGGADSLQAPPPPPLDALHTSLEPPEDLVAAIGEINMAATQIIADQFDLSNDELLNGLPLIDMSKTKFASICPLLVRQDLKCELTRFRSFTGHCNNLKHPTWGAAKTPYARYLPPVHPDGIWTPRKSIVSEITFDLGIGHRETHTDFSSTMPLPAVHKDESHGGQHFSATTTGLLEKGAAGAPLSPLEGAHRMDVSLNSIEEPNVSELENQAEAELMREAHDDGTNMDMASSVTFARHAHPDNNFLESDQIRFLEGGLTPSSALLHHHHRIATNEAAAHRHIYHMAPLPPIPPSSTPLHNPAALPSLPAPIIHRPHKSRSIQHELPSARLVSSIVHRDADIPNHEFTMLFLSWGQLLDHDMTRAATPPQTIKCCPSANGEPPAKNKLCLPIKVPPNDPFYSKFGVQCLEFRRTLAGVRPNCVLGPRVHQNANTAPIDANFVYGSSQATADSLRLFKGGRLRDRDWFRSEGLKPLLPAQEIDPDLNCLGRPKDLFCFLAGDVRVNEQTHLTVLHTLYMREHNRIADKLSELNPHWDDERTFQETRHLVAAGVQHVLINEYIPLLVGRKMTELYNLTVSMPSNALAHHHHHHHHHQTAGYWHGYDPTVTTSVSNSFAAAAFRQGHTFVQSTIDRFNKFHEFVTSEKLRYLFMQPFLLYQPGVMDELVSGMINRQSQSYDPFMTEELAGHLFQPPEAEFGQDLASINLQRGRDQGLPGYNLFREWCGLPRAETFEQLEPYLTNRTAYLYSKLYKHVDDIDLWSAGISERKLPGAAIGPTFSCIISRQFSNTRRGDRFWYENPGLPSSFTPDQLAEIKKITLAKLLCTNADDLPTIQRWAFRMAHPVLNPRVDCSQLPEIDLQYWQEE